MQQIEPKENPFGLKVFINGIPDLNAIPKEKAESILTALELEISEYYGKRLVSLADLRNAEGETPNIFLNCLEK